MAICIEFLGIARAGKSTTAKALRKIYEENNLDYIDFTEFQKIKRGRKYLLLLYSSVFTPRFNDAKFILAYLIFMSKVLIHGTSLDKKRLAHPLKYYFIKKYLVYKQQDVIIEDGATHILAGFSFTDSRLQSLMIGKTITVIVLNEISIENVINRLKDENVEKPWDFDKIEDYEQMYTVRLANQNDLLLNVKDNAVIFRVDANEAPLYKAGLIFKFLMS